jgi:hypothetical protein
MTRRPIYDLACIVLFVFVAAWLMHLTDAEPALPRCPRAATAHAYVTRCEP